VYFSLLFTVVAKRCGAERGGANAQGDDDGVRAAAAAAGERESTSTPIKYILLLYTER